jgi:acyl-coenzyme A thioesterase PaaI-like protein
MGSSWKSPSAQPTANKHGFAHGGLLGYAADNALTFAAGAVAGPKLLTAGYTINVLAPVLGDHLLARAWVISSNLAVTGRFGSGPQPRL